MMISGKEMGEGGAALLIGMAALFAMYLFASFILSHIFVILPVTLALFVFGVWRWGVARR